MSQICRRTTVSESESTTRFARKLAPTVEVIFAGSKAPLQYLMTRDVLPTPWAPRTTILASSDDMMRGGGRPEVKRRRISLQIYLKRKIIKEKKTTTTHTT